MWGCKYMKHRIIIKIILTIILILLMIYIYMKSANTNDNNQYNDTHIYKVQNKINFTNL